MMAEGNATVRRSYSLAPGTHSVDRCPPESTDVIPSNREGSSRTCSWLGWPQASHTRSLADARNDNALEHPPEPRLVDERIARVRRPEAHAEVEDDVLGQLNVAARKELMHLFLRR